MPMTDRIYIEAFCKIIEEKRAKLGFSQKRMADELGMSLTDYKSMLNDTKVHLSISTLLRAERITQTNIYELVGEMHPDLKMLKDFRSLPGYRQCAIRSMIETDWEISKQLPKINNEYTVPCFILAGNMADGMYFNSTNFVPIDVGQYVRQCSESIDCAVRITSNHLHPVYNLNDILLVHRAAPRDGDIGIFIHLPTSRLYIRKFRQTQPCQLIPINDYGSIITVDSYNTAEMDEWLKYGYVLTKMR